MKKKFEQGYLGKWTDLTPKRPAKDNLHQFNVGDVVVLTGTHPFKGERGEIVSFDFVGLHKREYRPKVRLFDMGDHEVYIMTDSDARVLK